MRASREKDGFIPLAGARGQSHSWPLVDIALTFCWVHDIHIHICKIQVQAMLCYADLDQESYRSSPHCRRLGRVGFSDL